MGKLGIRQAAEAVQNQLIRNQKRRHKQTVLGLTKGNAPGRLARRLLVLASAAAGGLAYGRLQTVSVGWGKAEIETAFAPFLQAAATYQAKTGAALLTRATALLADVVAARAAQLSKKGETKDT